MVISSRPDGPLGVTNLWPLWAKSQKHPCTLFPRIAQPEDGCNFNWIDRPNFPPDRLSVYKPISLHPCQYLMAPNFKICISYQRGWSYFHVFVDPLFSLFAELPVSLLCLLMYWVICLLKTLICRSSLHMWGTDNKLQLFAPMLHLLFNSISGFSARGCWSDVYVQNLTTIPGT